MALPQILDKSENKLVGDKHSSLFLPQYNDKDKACNHDDRCQVVKRFSSSVKI